MKVEKYIAHTLGVDKDKSIILKREDGKHLAVICNTVECKDGIYDGEPLYVFHGQQAWVMYSLLGETQPFTDMYSGKIDWESRLGWLECFSDENKQLALRIEKEISNNVSITLTKSEWALLVAAACTHPDDKLTEIIQHINEEIK